MGLDKVKGKEKTKKDISWTDLIEYSEQQIRDHQERIKSIRKSLVFFKKQAECGIPFIPEKQNRHNELS